MLGYVRVPQLAAAILFNDVIWNKAYRVAALAGYYRIFSHIFLSVTSRWQKSMESSGYGMVDTYQPFNKHIAI